MGFDLSDVFHILSSFLTISPSYIFCSVFTNPITSSSPLPVPRFSSHSPFFVHIFPPLNNPFCSFIKFLYNSHLDFFFFSSHTFLYYIMSFILSVIILTTCNFIFISLFFFAPLFQHRATHLFMWQQCTTKKLSCSSLYLSIVSQTHRNRHPSTYTGFLNAVFRNAALNFLIIITITIIISCKAHLSLLSDFLLWRIRKEIKIQQ